jgi:small subunit ribosomal protein S17
MSQQAEARPRRKTRVGVVMSAKMDKTIVVELTRQFAHPLYGKRLTRTKRVHAHDEHGARAGDTVRVMETRRLSKLKRWRVVEIVTRAE